MIHFRASFAYLARMDKDISTKIGRLKYRPKTRKWDFAVFKYNNEKYDPNEWMFPGNGLLDSTIEGAMKAGMKIYPPSSGLKICFNFWGCLLLLFLIPGRLIIFSFRKIFGRR